MHLGLSRSISHRSPRTLPWRHPRWPPCLWRRPRSSGWWRTRGCCRSADRTVWPVGLCWGSRIRRRRSGSRRRSRSTIRSEGIETNKSELRCSTELTEEESIKISCSVGEIVHCFLHFGKINQILKNDRFYMQNSYSPLGVARAGKSAGCGLVRARGVRAAGQPAGWRASPPDGF